MNDPLKGQRPSGYVVSDRRGDRPGAAGRGARDHGALADRPP
ncbi:hypothetical protein QJS66_05945 [Kocuria rhizophila]|nr:hypothetical protein QJS66_05945 [Kocuria rhizophila]